MFEISHLCYVSQIFIEMEVSGMRFVLGCQRVYSELPQFQPLYEHQFRMAANVLPHLSYHSSLLPVALLPYHLHLCSPVVCFSAILISFLSYLPHCHMLIFSLPELTSSLEPFLGSILLPQLQSPVLLPSMDLPLFSLSALCI